MQSPFTQGMPSPGTSSPQLPPSSMQGFQQSQANQPGLSRADQYMQTANRFLNTAQQFAPIVQQVAPMLQNLPAMWRLYKGFQSIPDAPTPQTANPVAAGNPSRSIPSDQPAAPRIYQPPF
ncbi:YqfQ family protein [Sporosarcina sp. PTS2304]|uniref:YqfQ family protein n=1 Tax=Sporosarcina sp. PTS2304 TaxID=2283194 RepID=UPI001F085F9B|nr:YqfQ family protein [Sporosarcina sp. PTS2304]